MTEHESRAGRHTPGLSAAQRHMLAGIPDNWTVIPIFGDSRPRAPLIRKGLIEQRHIDVTPTDWGTSPVRVVRAEWRRTETGRAALSLAIVRALATSEPKDARE